MFQPNSDSLQIKAGCQTCGIAIDYWKYGLFITKNHLKWSFKYTWDCVLTGSIFWFKTNCLSKTLEIQEHINRNSGTAHHSSASCFWPSPVAVQTQLHPY